MEDYSYENEYQFLDLTNLDQHDRDELAALLKENTGAEKVKFPWISEENDYQAISEPVGASFYMVNEPKEWSQYEMDRNLMKYENQANASSSVLSSVSTTMPQYNPQVMAPMAYSQWPSNMSNMYINNMASDPNINSYIQGMAYQPNIYSPSNEAPQDLSAMREGGRRGRGRGNKNYNRNMNHSNEIQAGYVTDHNQYQLSMPYHQQQYLCYSNPTIPSRHHAAGQTIYYPPQIYHTSTMEQQTRVDYVHPYHQSPSNTKHSRPSPSILPQVNGESRTKSANYKSYEKPTESVNVAKPSIHQLHNDENQSQTNIVTTVIVNNSNVESSVNDVEENTTANNSNNNSSTSNKKIFKIEQHISTTHENFKGAEKTDVSCVNIKSSIEVKQNGNDKEQDETAFHVKTPQTQAPAATVAAATTTTTTTTPQPTVAKPTVTKPTVAKPAVEKPTVEKPTVEECQNQVEVKEEPTEIKEKGKTSWANILKKGSEHQAVSVQKPTAIVVPNSTTANNDQVEQSPEFQKTPLTSKSSYDKQPSKDVQQKDDVSVEHKPLNTNTPQTYCDDPTTYRMGEFLLGYQIDKQTVSLSPRGLTNRSNYCYINSILQALLACPPFYNLFMAMPCSKNPSKHSPSPLVDNMIKFVREFSPLPEGARLARKDRAQKRNEDAVVDIHSGVPFEPSYLYSMLKNTSSGVFSVEGRQEDAEEFLSCLLNGLSDEMLELMKLANNNEQKSVDIVNTNVNYNEDEEEWKVMGRKNKGSVTRSTDFGRTPLSDIFRGQLRSKVSRESDQATDYVQPFFTLQLDIEKAESVKSALEILVRKDPLEGITCSKTKQEIKAWKQVLLEELPVILILHLKWFNYKPDGCSKIVKSVEFPIDLKIDTKLMSMNSRPKLNPKQRQYKLFAVTYHDGKEATKGHYVTDAFHVGYGGWVRYDDSSLKGVSEANVLNPLPPRVPYLLYYRRCDTIGNNQSNNVKTR